MARASYGREAGVHRLEAEDALQPLVVEVAGDAFGQLAEATEANEPKRGPERAGEVERGVEVAVDERRHLELVQLRQPVAEPMELARPRASREVADLVRHRVAPVTHVQRRAVFEAGAVHGVDGVQREEVVHVRADRREAVADELGHRQHRRAGVEAVAAHLERTGAPAGDRRAFEHQHVVPASAQMTRRAEAAEARADHHHSHDQPLTCRARPRTPPARPTQPTTRG